MDAQKIQVGGESLFIQLCIDAKDIKGSDEYVEEEKINNTYIEF